MSRTTDLERSTSEVAALLGLSRQRVERIEANAMRKFREAFAGDMDDYMPAHSVSTGRWNRKRIVRVCR